MACRLPTLVTGGTGFIGGNLVEELVSQGEDVRVLVRKTSDTETVRELGVDLVIGDLNDIDSLRKALNGCETLYHTAALFEIRLSREQKKQVYTINVNGTRNILSAALKEGVEKVVYTSTVATMAIRDEDGLIREDMKNTSPLPNDYAKSKYLAEIEAQEFYKKGLPLVVVAPTWVIGSGDTRPTPSGKTIIDFLQGKLPGYIEVFLNLVYVKDVARGHIQAAKKGRIGEKYILGGENVTMSELMELLSEISGKKTPRKIPRWMILITGYFQFFWSMLTGKPPMIPIEFVKESRIDMRCDLSKATKELGYHITPLRDALIETMNWYKENGYVSL